MNQIGSAVQSDESERLVQAQNGNIEAFSSLVETYQRPVYNLCYRMLNNVEDAEDAAQETFLRAYNSMKRYDNNRPFGTWLLSIAAHYCIDQIRKRKMIFISIDEHPQLDVPDDIPGPESMLSRKEIKIQLQEMLNTLNPVDRAAVVMYYWYDFSYEEIAEALTITQSALKSRLHRARRELSQKWMEKHPAAVSLERMRNESPAF